MYNNYYAVNEPEDQDRRKPPYADYAHTVTVLLRLLPLILYASAFIPNYPPFRENAYLNFVLFLWQPKIWYGSIALGAIGTFILPFIVKTNWPQILVGIVNLGLAVWATYYINVLLLSPGKDYQSRANGFLRMCTHYCTDDIYKACYRLPRAQPSDSIDFLRDHVFGPLAEVKATSTQSAVTFQGTTGKTCVVPYTVVDNQVFITVDGWDGIQMKNQGHISVDLTDCDGLDSMPMISRKASWVVSAARALPKNLTLGASGCSYGGKVALWAVANEPQLFSELFVDSGGSMGPASMKRIGPCGETFAAMKFRYPGWLLPNATDVEDWPEDVDVANLLIHSCKQTKIHISVAREDSWNNFEGTVRTVRWAREAGCEIDYLEDNVFHCHHFQ